MRIILVGASNSGKREVAQNLAKNLSLPMTDSPADKYDLALGQAADYRMEMQLALDRWWQSQQDDLIQVHSLVDSAAYSSLRLDLADDDVTTDADYAIWWLTATTILSIVRDSLRYDHVFLVPGGDDEDEIQGVLPLMLSLLEIPFEILEGSPLQMAELAATIVRNGKRIDHQEPRGEDQ